MSNRELEAALAFARTKPTEWEAFKAEWMASHLEPVIIVDVKDLPVETELIITSTDKPETGYIKIEPKKRK